MISPTNNLASNLFTGEDSNGDFNEGLVNSLNDDLNLPETSAAMMEYGESCLSQFLHLPNNENQTCTPLIVSQAATATRVSRAPGTHDYASIIMQFGTVLRRVG